MIISLQGRVVLRKDNFIVLEVQGVGYEVFASKSSLKRIPKNSDILKLFCYLDVGERSLALYGFLSFEEREFFKTLRNISGIGPKAALEISSIGTPEMVKKEIERGNEKIFEGIPGIGSKKARKIILELSGKLGAPAQKKQNDFSEDEAFSALINLGFDKSQTKKALSQLPKDIQDSEQKIKTALKILGK